MNVSLVQDEGSGNMRRAALLLHGLCEIDRAWLLQRLDAARREQLTTLLGELRTLGIPADAGAAFQPSEPRAAEVPRTPHSIVAQAAPAQVSAALKDEPAGLVARLLAAGAWDWQAAFMALQTPTQRRQIQELLGGSRVGPKLAENLVRELAERLTDAHAAGRRGRLEAPWKEWLASVVKRVREIGGLR